MHRRRNGIKLSHHIVQHIVRIDARENNLVQYELGSSAVDGFKGFWQWFMLDDDYMCKKVCKRWHCARGGTVQEVAQASN